MCFLQKKRDFSAGEAGKVEEGGLGARIPEFDPILEMSSAGDGASRTESFKHKTTTVNRVLDHSIVEGLIVGWLWRFWGRREDFLHGRV